MSRSKPPGQRGLFNAARTFWIAENQEVAQLASEVMVWESHLDRECRSLALSDHVDPGTAETRFKAEARLNQKGRVFPPRVLAWRRLQGIFCR